MTVAPLEIVDENGNVHGPFVDREEMMRYVDSRGLGEERHEDDEVGRGWYMRSARPAS